MIFFFGPDEISYTKTHVHRAFLLLYFLVNLIYTVTCRIKCDEMNEWR